MGLFHRRTWYFVDNDGNAFTTTDAQQAYKWSKFPYYKEITRREYKKLVYTKD